MLQFCQDMMNYAYHKLLTILGLVQCYTMFYNLRLQVGFGSNPPVHILLISMVRDLDFSYNKDILLILILKINVGSCSELG